MKEKQEEHNTGSNNYKPRKRRKKRTDPKKWNDSELDRKTERQTTNLANSVTHQIGTRPTNIRYWKNSATITERKDTLPEYVDKKNF